MAAALLLTKFGFGIEIEAVGQPWKVREEWISKPQEYYERLAQALRNRNLVAVADKLDTSYQCQHPEHYNKWFITSDGSLQGTGTQVCLEAVSPVLYIADNWEEQLAKFWQAMRKVFKVMENDSCGSHIHVAPANRRYTLGELKTIAFAIITHEHFVKKLLPRARKDNRYCKLNSEVSPRLASALCTGKNATVFKSIGEMIKNIQDASKIKELMQGSGEGARYVVWNFVNVASGRSGTIEFRGGRHLRGPNRSYWWITFAVVFISLSLKQNLLGAMAPPLYNTPNDTPRGPFQNQMFRLWEELKEEADRLGIGGHLPASWKRMMEQPNSA